MSREWRNRFPTRRRLFLGAGGLAFLGITVRLAELQLLRAEEFDTLAEDNRIRLDPAPPHRGTIFDRNGIILAGNKRNFYVTLTPEQAGSRQDVADVVKRLSEVLLNKDGEPLLSEAKQKRILQDAASQARFVEIVVADDLTWEDFARISVRAPELAGVSAKVGELRSYPYGAAFAHTVGWVQRASDADVDRLIKASGEDPATVRRLYRNPDMRLGKLGVESFAESTLRGDAGYQRMLVNAAGRMIEELPSEDLAAKKGGDIVLSLDAKLQQHAIQRFGDESGSAVVIDIKTGDVVVMVSTPAPDPTLFVSGISTSDYHDLVQNERNPLYHKAFEGIYPPGSTFKTVVATAALESGAMKPEDTVRCSGKAWYYNRFYHCWRPEGHGMMNMHNAIAHSCDCYFYEAARRTGIEKIAEVAKRLGLGHRYELGLTGGKAGVVPNDAWKRQVMKEKWYDGDTISAGIGQGYVTASPFQLAVMCARIAGGPQTPNPRLVVRGLKVPDQAIMPMGEFSERTLQMVRAGMFGVASEPGGTAYNYVQHGELDPKGELPAPYTNAKMAGKSGSAQVRVINMEERNAKGAAIKDETLPWKLRDHAWFIAFAPYDAPRYACAVLVEHGSHGSQTAAPFAHDILVEVLKADPGGKEPYTPKAPPAESTTPRRTSKGKGSRGAAAAAAAALPATPTAADAPAAPAKPRGQPT